MVVYVEYVILDNMVINTIILTLTKILLKLNTKKITMLFSAFVGTIFALLSPLLPNTINLLLKLPLAFLMIYISFKPKKFKQMFIILLTFFASTFALIGTCLGIAEILSINYIINSGITYQYNFPVGFILLVCIISYYCLKNIIAYIFKRHAKDKYLYDIVLENDSIIIKATAFLDTGNILEYNGKPITIINYKIFEKLYPSISITDILLKKPLPLKNANYYEIKSLTRKENILIFEINCLKIDKKEQKNAILGLSLHNFENSTKSDLIISGKIFN